MDGQELINGLDKTTVDGLAEAICIAVSSVKDDEDKLRGLQLDPGVAKQVATMLLGEPVGVMRWYQETPK